MPVNSDAMTRAELRRTRLDLIRQEYEVNRISRAHSMNFSVILFEKIKSPYEFSTQATAKACDLHSTLQKNGRLVLSCVCKV